MRVGQGFDAHRFADDPSRELWLGLVHVADAPGLDGHSDADVVAHAVCDALLGAAALGDLGRHFPSSDPSLRGAPSSRLLTDVVAMVRAADWDISNVDVTIVAERPRLAARTDEMGAALSAVVGAPVSVKVTSTDGLGAIGRGDGIAALAVALLKEQP